MGCQGAQRGHGYKVTTDTTTVSAGPDDLAERPAPGSPDAGLPPAVVGGPHPRPVGVRGLRCRGVEPHRAGLAPEPPTARLRWHEPPPAPPSDRPGGSGLVGWQMALVVRGPGQAPAFPTVTLGHHYLGERMPSRRWARSCGPGTGPEPSGRARDGPGARTIRMPPAAAPERWRSGHRTD